MPDINPERRAQEIKMRRLEIAAELAESKRDYIVDRGGMSFADRVTLEAEDAQLALEARQIAGDAEAAKVERRRRLNADVLAMLTAILKERGLGELVTEAERRSAEALAAQQESHAAPAVTF